MKRNLTLFTFVLFFLSSTFAQERYIQEVFTDDQITLTSDIQYATNATIFGKLFDPNIDEFIPEPLFMDVYQPAPNIDGEENRPVVLVIHGGDNLPRLTNGACWGDKTDSVTVTTARKLARMGYVAIAPNYRLGRNPLTTSQDVFLDGLVDAAIRTQQDIRACARWLRKNIVEEGNAFNIHPEKIAVWGTASSAGMYCAMAAYIDEDELQTPTFFVTDELGNISNVYNQAEAGNIEGTVFGLNSIGDTTNYVNTPGYSSDFQLAALGSAFALDPGTVDPDEPPMILFDNPANARTQFSQGPIQLPTTGQVVAFVQLSQGLIMEAVAAGVNDAWINAGFSDPYTIAQRADPNFGAVEGWLPLYGHPDNEYPWVHWDEVNCPVSTQSFDILPGANRNQAVAQIDTMAGYFGVRACLTLDLNCGSITGTKEAILDEKMVRLSPNPSSGGLRLEANHGRTIKEVLILSFDGKLVERFEVNTAVFQKDQLQLSPGLYTVMTRFEDGVISKKWIIHP